MNYCSWLHDSQLGSPRTDVTGTAKAVREQEAPRSPCTCRASASPRHLPWGGALGCAWPGKLCRRIEGYKYAMAMDYCQDPKITRLCTQGSMEGGHSNRMWLLGSVPVSVPKQGWFASHEVLRRLDFGAKSTPARFFVSEGPLRARLSLSGFARKRSKAELLKRGVPQLMWPGRRRAPSSCRGRDANGCFSMLP